MILTASLLSVFVFSFTVGFGAVISPGPLSTAIVSQAPRRGWMVGPLLAAGHSFMELILLILVAVGLSAGLASPGIHTVIAILGGLLLIFMGASMLRDIWRGKIRLPSAEEKLQPVSSRQLVGMGMLATASSPFWYAWWVTFVPGYLSLKPIKELGLAAVAAFFVGHIVADFAWDTFLSAAIGGGRRWMNDTIYRGLILLCALFFIYLGFGFIRQGLGV